MKKVDRISLNIAEFTDDTGRLKSPFLPPRPGLWIPPSVDIRDGRLVYPVPKRWPSLVSADIGVVAVPDFPDTFGFYDLESDSEGRGWTHKTVTKPDGLLDAFVRLAKASDARIEKFVLRWGPLWHCTKHGDCLWQPHFFRPESRQHRNCEWLNAEPLAEFRRRARQVEAALKICAHLKTKNDTTTPELWECLIPDWSRRFSSQKYLRLSKSGQVKIQRAELAGFVNDPLYGLDRNRFRIDWYDNEEPKLEIDTGLGFLPVVWMQAAQVMTDTGSVLRCDGCGVLYPRDVRKPAKGRRNFCFKCREGDRGSKRESARARRHMVGDAE